MEKKLELIRGLDIINSKMIVRVESGGCTEKEHFKIEVNKGITQEPPFIIEIYRTIPDECEAYLPDGVVIEFDLSDLGLNQNDQLEIANRFKVQL